MANNKKQQRSNNVVTPPHHHGEEDESNPYLALRQANIARNEARLRELGLLHETTSTPSSSTNKRSRSTTSDPKVTTQNSHPNKRTSRRTAGTSGEWKANDKEDPVTIPAEEEGDDGEASPTSSGIRRPLRRSRRTLGRSVDYKEKSPSVVTTTTRVDHGIQRWEGDYDITDDVLLEQARKVVEDDIVAGTSKPGKRVSPAPSLAPNSARNISLDIHRLVWDPDNNNNNNKGWLGKPMTATGKAMVMETAAQQFATEQPLQFHKKVSFNKYSGAQEWKRGIFLWVNLGGPTTTVANDFLAGGRQMTWYGGARMKPTSNMIQKLVTVGKATGDDRRDGIVLWCRRYETVRRTFGPYYCLGRLAYQSHNPNVMPVAFVWNLIDYEALIQTGSQVAKEMIAS